MLSNKPFSICWHLMRNTEGKTWVFSKRLALKILPSDLPLLHPKWIAGAWGSFSFPVAQPAPVSVPFPPKRAGSCPHRGPFLSPEPEGKISFLFSAMGKEQGSIDNVNGAFLTLHSLTAADAGAFSLSLGLLNIDSGSPEGAWGWTRIPHSAMSPPREGGCVAVGSPCQIVLPVISDRCNS